jgi:uncharacterized protein involved in exopolysaccharide biosynthesis
MADEIVLDRRRTSRASSPTLRDVLSVLFRQRKLGMISFAAIFLGAVLYGFLLPSYQAQMRVLVRRGRVDPPMTAQPTALSEFSRYEVTEEELNSEVELLRDQDILRRVVLATKLDVPQRHFWNWGKEEGEARIARAVRQLAKRLKVEPVRKTRLISVAYESSDPALAARVLDTLASGYLEKHLEVHRPSGEFRFFEQQTKQYGQALDQAESQLLDLIREKGVVSASLERDMALQKLSDADASQRQIAVAMAETGQRVRALEAQLATLPERTTTEIRTSDNAQLLQQLKSTLLTLELKRAELITKFQPTYRLVEEVDRQIAETKAAIAREQFAPVREQTTEKDPNREWAKAELEKAQVELSALRGRAEASAVLVSNYRSLARQLGEDSIRQQDLARTAKTAEENYLLYVRKREEARIGDALDERGILNVTVVEAPRVPALPKYSPVMFACFGFVVAVTVSTGLAFAADYLDPALRTPEEVTVLLGAPVLASLPRCRA